MAKGASKSDSPAPPVPLRRGRARAQRGWRRWFPGLLALQRYEWASLPHDLMAGLALSAVLVPVGVAYAVASGVPPISGLYATIFGLLAYAVFGPSRVLVLGPDSSLVALVLGVVLPLSAGDPQRAVGLAAMMAVVSGGLCIVAGVARLGFVTELLSKPIRYGYMNGIALSVLVSQLPTLFGFSASARGPLPELQAFAAGVLAGRTNLTALALGGATLALILLLNRHRPWPGVLMAVAGATAIVAFGDLGRQAGVPVLAALPQGMPALRLPTLAAGDAVSVLLGGAAVALVSFADTSVVSRIYAAKAGATADADQEMIGLGAANLAAGLFQGLPVSASASRTPVAEAAGARTQMTGVVGAVTLMGLVVAAPTWLRHLPTASLAAVVVASAIGLMEVADLRRIYRIQRWEFWLSIGCLVGVVVLGAIPGIALAIVAAVIEFLWDGWRPYSAVLGRVDGVKGYHDVTRHPEARLVPGLVLFRWDAPLFFANAELFRDRVLEAALAAPGTVNWLVVGAEPVTSVDVTAADVLLELDGTLRAAGITLCFAEMKDPVKDKLKRFGLLTAWGQERFFDTMGEAVNAFVRSHGVARSVPVSGPRRH